MTDAPRHTLGRTRQLGQGHVHLDADPTYARAVMRHVSPYLTYAIVRFTGLSADAVTAAAILSGVVGGLLTAVPSVTTNLLAIGLLQLAYLLDVADGEVARVRGTAGKRGTYLDLIGHYVQNRALYAGATFAFIIATDTAWWSIWIALIGVAFASAFGEQARNQVLGRGDASSPHGARSPAAGGTRAGGWSPYAVYRRTAFVWNYPASMNLFCIALAIDAIRFGLDPAAEALVLPWFAAGFVVTLAMKQLANAIRQLSPSVWR